MKMNKKITIAIFLISFFLIITIGLSTTFKTIYNPFTGKLDYYTLDAEGNLTIENLTVTGNVTAAYLFGNINCTYLFGDDTDFCSDLAGAGETLWIDNGTFISPNATYAENVNMTGAGQYLDYTTLFENGTSLTEKYWELGDTMYRANISDYWTYNLSYEYWTNTSLDWYDNTTIFRRDNSSYEYWTNASLDWQSNTTIFDMSNESYVPYTGAEQNVDLGIYNLTINNLTTASSVFVGGDLNVSGTSNLDGNLMPITTLSHDIGSGVLRWGDLYVSDISADSIDAAVNITALGNVSAVYFLGSGAYLTNLNVTGDITGYILNISYLCGHTGIGCIEMRGDPWYLSGVDLEIDQDLKVNNTEIERDLDVGGNVTVDGNVTITGNISATYFVGSGAELTGITASNSSYEYWTNSSLDWYDNTTIFDMANISYEYTNASFANLDRDWENTMNFTGNISTCSNEDDIMKMAGGVWTCEQDAGTTYTNASWSLNEIDLTECVDCLGTDEILESDLAIPWANLVTYDLNSDWDNLLYFNNLTKCDYAGEVMEMTGGVWGCAANYNYNLDSDWSGSMLAGTNITTCAENQILKTVTGVWMCAADAGTAYTNASFTDLNRSWVNYLHWGNLTGFNLDSAWTGSLHWDNLTAYDLDVDWTGSLDWGNISNAQIVNTSYEYTNASFTDLNRSWENFLHGGNITANSLGASQIDESSLVPQTSWYNTTTQVIDALDGNLTFTRRDNSSYEYWTNTSLDWYDNTTIFDMSNASYDYTNASFTDLNRTWENFIGWGNVSERSLDVAWSGSLHWGNLSDYNLDTVWTGSLDWGNISNAQIVNSSYEYTNASFADLNRIWENTLGWGNLTTHDLDTSWVGSLDWGNISNVQIVNSSYEYWDNSSLDWQSNTTIFDMSNSSYEYWTNASLDWYDNTTIFDMSNSSYDFTNSSWDLDRGNSSTEIWAVIDNFTFHKYSDTMNSPNITVTDNWNMSGKNLTVVTNITYGESDAMIYWNGTCLITDGPTSTLEVC